MVVIVITIDFVVDLALDSGPVTPWTVRACLWAVMVIEKESLAWPSRKARTASTSESFLMFRGLLHCRRLAVVSRAGVAARSTLDDGDGDGGDSFGVMTKRNGGQWIPWNSLGVRDYRSLL